ncbi:hypothetical protein K501DRAFT_203482 [Backusella circina FSU 941]|nr:hypothetical protein K501DRAFT_203482 [Backusella circina FSU 941]
MLEKLIPSQKSYKFFQNLHTSTPDNTVEVREPIILQKVSGEVPDWLNGIMYRIGPGIFQIPQEGGTTYVIRHAFDGLSVAHRFEISGKSQTVKYNSRCLADGIISDIQQKRYKGLIYFGHITEVSFASWLPQFITRLSHMFDKEHKDPRPDSVNVGVTLTPNFPMPKKFVTSHEEQVVVAKTDANTLQKINATTLEPELAFNYTSFDSKITGPFSAAHHQTDIKTGEVVNFTGDISPKPAMHVFSLSPSGQSTLLANITHRLDEKKTPIQLPYIHSFWMTENYVIIPEFPLCIAGTGIDIMVHGAVISSLSWDKNRPTYLHIIRRRLDPKEQGNGHIATIPVPGFFTFHTANAFESVNEKNETILNLDCCAYPSGDILFKVHALNTDQKANIVKEKNKETSHNGINDAEHSNDTFGELRRYVLNLTKKRQEEITTAIVNIEFPRFNQEYLFQDYKYVYGTQHLAHQKVESAEICVVKVDMTDNSNVIFQKQGFSFSEPVFVQRASAEAEDDGVLLTLGNTIDCCYIVILDAVTMKELACFTIGEFKASSLHGSFVDYDFTPININ